MDYQYIEDLRALEDKKEAKEKLVEYAEQFGLKVKKTRSFDNLVLDIEAGLKELANEPMPEDNEGLSISDLIDADDDLAGKNDFVEGHEGAKEEAKLLFDAPTETPAVYEVKPSLLIDGISAPIGEVVVAVMDIEGKQIVVQSPVKPINEEALKEAIQKIADSEAKTEEPIIYAPYIPVVVQEMFELPDNYSPSLIKIGPGAGYCTLPWWVYEWIEKTPDWKSKPNSFPHHYGIDTIMSLIYYIKREGSVRIRETRNSRFIVLN